MIEVLVVDDSPVAREVLAHIFQRDPEIRVVGLLKNGEEALEFLKETKPDVITMDLHMPGMDGFETTRRIMETYPTPVVIVSGSHDPDEMSRTFRAMEAGALAILERPPGIGAPEHEDAVRELVQTVRLMAEVKVVRRWARARQAPQAHGASSPRPGPGFSAPSLPPAPSLANHSPRRNIALVVIGGSTGAPLVLQTILGGLPGEFPLPVLIVQHMAAGFLQGFVHWLNQSSRVPVHLAEQGSHLLPGYAYVAPDGFQMKVVGGGRVALTQDGPLNGHKPSVSYLFRSAAEVYGEKVAAVLLTGMGRDGAVEIKMLREMGGLTIVQDEESSVVPGMPGEAIRLQAAEYIFPPDLIAHLLLSLGRREG